MKRLGMAGPRLLTAADLARPVPECDASISVGEAAKLMTSWQSTAILVRGANGYGIVTDHDLRTRVIAQGFGADRPVGTVASSPVVAVEPERLVEDVLIEMLERNLHHLPVTDGARMVGMVSHLDILGIEALHPFHLVQELAGAADTEGLMRAAANIPATMAAVEAEGIRASRACQVMSLMVDTVTRRALDLTIAELGEPPAAWAWIALGSHGRREQGIRTDQDHALVIDGSQADPYFEALARRVVVTLAECGIPPCPSGLMASEPGWRRTPSEWRNRLRTWITAWDIGTAFFTEIVFDFRQVAGPLQAEPIFIEAVMLAREQPAFLSRLARLAIQQRPPLRPLHLGLKVSAGQIDVKAGGLRSLSELARLMGLEAGCTSPMTISRLRAATAEAVRGSEQADDLEEAFEVLTDIRLGHQLRRHRASEAIDDNIRVSELGRIERTRLRQAFSAVRRAQRWWTDQLALRVRG
jgi:CBS domain-containing protein